MQRANRRLRAKPLSARRPLPSRSSDEGSGTGVVEEVAVTVPEMSSPPTGPPFGPGVISPKKLNPVSSIVKGPPVFKVGGVPSVKPPQVAGDAELEPKQPKAFSSNIKMSPFGPVNVILKSPPFAGVKKLKHGTRNVGVLQVSLRLRLGLVMSVYLNVTGLPEVMPLPMGVVPSRPEGTEKVRVKTSPGFDSAVDGKPEIALNVPSTV